MSMILPSYAGFNKPQQTAGLLLDGYNVDFAVDIIKVLSSYNGYVMRVRRVVDDVTADVDFYFAPPMTYPMLSMDSQITIVSGSSSANVLGELVAASGYGNVDSLGAATGADIEIWYDQSGNGYNAGQSVLSQQPRIINAGVFDMIDGRIAPYFNGDFLQSTQNLNYGTDSFSIIGFGVASDGQRRTLIAKRVNSSVAEAGWSVKSDGGVRNYLPNAELETGVGGVVSDGDIHLMGLVRTSGNSIRYDYKDTTGYAADYTGNQASVTNTIPIRIGTHQSAFEFWLGNIMGAYIFSEALSSSAISSICTTRMS